MAIVNQRWPYDIAPTSCQFGRANNDLLLRNPVSQATQVIRRSRPLWSAECSWTLGNTDKLARLRYWLEALEGFAGSVQIWDFASPYPFGISLATGAAPGELTRMRWTHGGNTQLWTFAGIPSQWNLESFVLSTGTAAAGATSINLTGLQASSYVCFQGQYLQIGRRLYIAAQTVQSDVSGNATVPLVRGLISAAPAGTEVRFSNAGCEMRLAAQEWKNSANANDGLVTVSASFVETTEDYV